MLGAVVVKGSGVAHNRHYNHINGVDLGIAVGDIEGDGLEVRVGVLKLGRSQAHGGGALVGSGSLRLAGEGEVAFLIEAIPNLHIVARDLQLRAVVGLLLGLALDRHGHVNGIHRDGAVGDIEGDRLEVRVGAGEVGRAQAHGSGARVSPLRLRGAAEDNVGFLEQAAADVRYLVPGGLMLGAVVVIGSGVAHNRYYNRINGVDLQVAGIRGDDNVFAGSVHGADGALGEGGGIGACVSAGGAYGDGGEAGFGCGYGVGVLNLSGNIEAADTLLSAVVGHFVGMGGQNHILIIVEGDHVGIRIRGDGDLLGCGAGGGIAGDLLGGLNLGLGVEGSVFLSLGVQQGVAPHIPDGVAQVIPDGPGAGEGYVLVGHGEGAAGHLGVGGGPAGEGVAGKGGLSCHGHGVTVGVSLRGGGSGGVGGDFVGVGIGHLEVGLLPVGNEGQVAGGAIGDDNRRVRLTVSAGGGGAFTHGPAKEGIALPGGIHEGDIVGTNRVGSGVGIGVAGVGPAGLYGIVGVIQIVGNGEILQLQLEHDHVLAVVAGQSDILGIAVLQNIALFQQRIRLGLGDLHSEPLGICLCLRSGQDHLAAITEFNRVAELIHRFVAENDLIFHAALQHQGLFRGVDNVAGVRALGGDRLGNDLRVNLASERTGGADLLILIGQVPHGVVNVLALNNLGVDDGILRQRLVEVEGRFEFRVLVPASEIIAGKQFGRHIFRFAIVGNRGGSQAAIRILVLHHKFKRDRIRLKLGIEGQILTGHGGEVVGIAQAFGIIIPALELIHIGKANLDSGVKVVAAAADVRAEADIGFGFQNCGVVVIGDVGEISVVVESEYFYSVLGCLLILARLIGVTIDIFRGKAGARAVVVCLGIPGAQRVAAAIRILQIVLNLVFRQVVFPLRRISNCGTVTADHIRGDFEPLGNIFCVCVTGFPATEGGAAPINLARGRPLGGNILSKDSGDGVVVAARVLGTALRHLDVGAAFIQLELESILNQGVLGIDNGGAVRLDHSAGKGGRTIACAGPDAGSGDGRTHGTGSRGASGIGIVGGIGAVVPDLLHGDDGVCSSAGDPLGVDRDIPGQLHRGAGGLGAGFIQIPAAKGIALTGGGGGDLAAGFIAAVRVDVFSLGAG